MCQIKGNNHFTSAPGHCLVNAAQYVATLHAVILGHVHLALYWKVFLCKAPNSQFLDCTGAKAILSQTDHAISIKYYRRTFFNCNFSLNHVLGKILMYHNYMLYMPSYVNGDSSILPVKNVDVASLYLHEPTDFFNDFIVNDQESL